MDAKWLISLGTDAHATATPYSGRGMYGKQSVSFRTEDPMSLISELFLAALARGWQDSKDFAQAFQAAVMDGLGRGTTVLYFPAMAWPADVKVSKYVDDDDDDDIERER